MSLGTSWAKAMLELEPALTHEDTGTKFSLDSRQLSKGQGEVGSMERYKNQIKKA